MMDEIHSIMDGDALLLRLNNRKILEKPLRQAERRPKDARSSTSGQPWRPSSRPNSMTPHEGPRSLAAA